MWPSSWVVRFPDWGVCGKSIIGDRGRGGGGVVGWGGRMTPLTHKHTYQVVQAAFLILTSV